MWQCKAYNENRFEKSLLLFQCSYSNNTVCCSLQPNGIILNWESSSKSWFAILIVPYFLKVSSVEGSCCFIVRFFSFFFQLWETEAPLERTPFRWLPLFSSLVFLIICGICKEKLEADQPWEWKTLGESLPFKPSLCARAVCMGRWDVMSVGWCLLLLYDFYLFVKSKYISQCTCVALDGTLVAFSRGMIHLLKKKWVSMTFLEEKIEQPGGWVL